MSRKNGCNNLYFHPYNLDETYKSFFLSDVTFPSWSGKSVNPTFPNINLTKTIRNLPVVSNVTKIWL